MVRSLYRNVTLGRISYFLATREDDNSPHCFVVIPSQTSHTKRRYQPAVVQHPVMAYAVARHLPARDDDTSSRRIPGLFSSVLHALAIPSTAYHNRVQLHQINANDVLINLPKSVPGSEPGRGGESRGETRRRRGGGEKRKRWEDEKRRKTGREGRGEEEKRRRGGRGGRGDKVLR